MNSESSNNLGISPSEQSSGLMVFFNLFRLYYHPRTFFERDFLRQSHIVDFLVVWMIGTIFSLDHIGSISLGIYSYQDGEIASFPLYSWRWFWFTGIVLGLASGGFYYAFLGSIYRLRILLCGVRQPDIYLSRRIMICTGFLFNFPFLVWNLGGILYYETPAEMLLQTLDPSVFPLYLLLPASIFLLYLVYWSVYVNYRGVRTCFPSRKGLARLWFVYLPLLIMVPITVGLLVFGHPNKWKHKEIKPVSYEQTCFSFQYPGNWSLDEEEDGYVAINSIQDGYVEIRVWKKDEEPADIRDYAKEIFQDTYDLQAQRAKKEILRKLGPHVGYGYKFNIVYDEKEISAIFFVGWSESHYFCIEMRAVKDDLPALEPGFDLIRDSFQLKE